MKDNAVKPGCKTIQGKFAQNLDGGFRSRVTRAQRYDIVTMMRYRIRGEKNWREGIMKNISITGVLIHATQSLPQDADIEMRFSLPINLNGENAAEVLCRGSVVRSSKCDGPDAAAAVAARISHSRFIRQMDKKDESPRKRTGETILKFD